MSAISCHKDFLPPLASAAIPGHNKRVMNAYANCFWFSTTRYFFFRGGGAGGRA